MTHNRNFRGSLIRRSLKRIKVSQQEISYFFTVSTAFDASCMYQILYTQISDLKAFSFAGTFSEG